MNIKVFFVLIISLLLVYLLFGSAIEFYLLDNMPWVVDVIDYTTENIIIGSYEGLFFFSFASTSPLFPVPTEFYLAYSYFLGNEPLLLLILASIGLTIGTFFHFVLGYIFGPRLVQFLLNRDIGEGGDNPFILAFIFIASAIPFFPDAFVMIYGAYRVSPKKFLIISFIGHTIRMIIVMYAIMTSATLFGVDLGQQDVNETIGTLNL